MRNESQVIKPMSQRLAEQKRYICERMGQDTYERVLTILESHKAQDSDSSAIYESLKPIMGKNRELKELCFSLEMLVFKE